MFAKAVFLGGPRRKSLKSDSFSLEFNINDGQIVLCNKINCGKKDDTYKQVNGTNCPSHTSDHLSLKID